jgi:nucleoside-diphosphate-sugar epimerase
MHILITGAAGMIGRKLTERLVKDQILDDKPLTELTLLDVVTPTQPAGLAGKVRLAGADLAAAGAAEQAIASRLKRK